MVNILIKLIKSTTPNIKQNIEINTKNKIKINIEINTKNKIKINIEINTKKKIKINIEINTKKKIKIKSWRDLRKLVFANVVQLFVNSLTHKKTFRIKLGFGY
jgi:hypothetical protein